MRPSNKSRSRSKNHNRRPSGGGNVINRVFDSSGPEGKVRGTPQQIIDKYQGLARDAQLSGDRVGAEAFLQHSEHYSRILGEAMREQTEKREAHEAQQAQHAQRRQNQNTAASNAHEEAQPDLRAPAPEKQDSGLVETPENTAAKRSAKKSDEPEASAAE